MNAMNCAEVHEQLDMFAADACDPSTREALQDHLKGCSQCAAQYQESQRLLALLDLHWNQEAAAQRLHERIEQRARPLPARRRQFARFPRGLIAAAAVLLMAVGVLWMFPNNVGDQRKQPGVEPHFALLVRAEGREALLPARKDDTQPRTAKSPEIVAVKVMPEMKGEVFRQKLAQAQRDGKVPEPTRVTLELRLVNAGSKPVHVQWDSASELRLDVQGEGVVRMPALVATARMLNSFDLKPGEEFVLTMDRLISESKGQTEYVYLTEPGEYMVTPQLRFMADDRVVTVRGETIRIKVAD